VLHGHNTFKLSNYNLLPSSLQEPWGMDKQNFIRHIVFDSGRVFPVVVREDLGNLPVGDPPNRDTSGGIHSSIPLHERLCRLPSVFKELRTFKIVHRAMNVRYDWEDTWSEEEIRALEESMARLDSDGLARVWERPNLKLLYVCQLRPLNDKAIKLEAGQLARLLPGKNWVVEVQIV
jgi:hypothetical protein